MSCLIGWLASRLPRLAGQLPSLLSSFGRMITRTKYSWKAWSGSFPWAVLQNSAFIL